MLTVDAGIRAARIYCPSETRGAFFKMWRAFFSVVETVTGRPLKLKPFDGGKKGLRVIVTDGDAAQAGGLADYLVTRNNEAQTGIPNGDPLDLLPHILRTCYVHAHRYAILRLGHSQH